MPIAQVNNEEMLRLMASRFRKIGDPIHAWGDIHSFAMSLPGLVGYWPGTIDRSLTPRILDASGNGLNLTRQGEAQYAFDETSPMTAYLGLDGVNDFYSHVDDDRLDILGNESIIANAIRGLTVMAWVYIDDLGGLDHPVIAKWNATGSQKSYLLGVFANGSGAIRVTGDGATEVISPTDAGLVVNGTWHFLAGRYIPSISLKVWVDLNTVTKTASIPATIHQGTADFTLGTDAGGTIGFLDGRIAHPIICASALSDSTVDSIYQMTSTLIRGVI